MVRLEIEQEIKDIGGRDPELGPTWTERKRRPGGRARSAERRDRRPDVRTRTYTRSKVPLLGDIPILGYLFKYTDEARRRPTC